MEASRLLALSLGLLLGRLDLPRPLDLVRQPELDGRLGRQVEVAVHGRPCFTKRRAKADDDERLSAIEFDGLGRKGEGREAGEIEEVRTEALLALVDRLAFPLAVFPVEALKQVALAEHLLRGDTDVGLLALMTAVRL
jgi:hypothetical protein